MGFADAKPGQPHEAEARRKARLFREVRLRRWGRTTFEKLQAEGRAVSLEEILKRST